MSEIRVLNDRISVNDRVFASAFSVTVFLAMFTATSLFRPSQLVMLRGLLSIRIPRHAAREICAAYSHPARSARALWRTDMSPSAAAVTPAEELPAAPAVAPAPAPAPATSKAPATTPGPAVALARALGEAVRAARCESGGDDARARSLLLGLLDEQLAATHRATLTLQHEALTRWTSQVVKEEETIRVLVPRFVPLVVDSSRTIASALGGARLNSLCLGMSRSRGYGLLTLLNMVVGYGLFFLSLSTEDKSAGGVVYGVLALAFTLNASQLLTLNLPILSSVILRRFDTYWALFNVFAVALSGFFIFTEARDGSLWLAGQMLMSTYFLLDAAPYSRRTRKLSPWRSPSTRWGRSTPSWPFGKGSLTSKISSRVCSAILSTSSTSASRRK